MVKDFQVFLDRMMLHHDMALEYRTKSFNAEILLIKAQDSTFVTDEFENNVCYGWSNYSENELEIISVPGNHITIIKQPNTKDVSAAIHAYLDKIIENKSINQQATPTVDI
jgi:thioesterase domain-containing protein